MLKVPAWATVRPLLQVPAPALALPVIWGSQLSPSPSFFSGLSGGSDLLPVARQPGGPPHSKKG